MSDTQRFKNLIYEVARTNQLIADLISQLRQTGHIPPSIADNLLQASSASQRRLKQLEPKDK